ncbi:anti-sigma factor antagonist [Saccharopolyspora rhizosphaerae]|uniref:Anti-sigma factor antagonist n=1 Tax=Saccharopolyspora rhizosphaerae TaxID=2492662 RepID=A0A426JLX4_9PSEU|nr:STAS domain-containing protein [Saccharopolyspora rhizosphaerae]RRO14154.1 anti-sigma factor antagonist [Saccharopolyspora rhizosphaerae]
MTNADVSGLESPVPAPRGTSPRSAGSVCGALRVRVVRPGGGVVVVQVSGEMDLAARHFLAEPVRQRLVGTAAVVVLDLSQVTFINSDGALALLEARHLADARHKELVLVSSRVVDRLLGLLKLSARFTYTTGEEVPASQ